MNENVAGFDLAKKSGTILYFWATWCGPCKTVGPIVEELSNKYKNVEWLKVNAEENAKLANDCFVMTLPTIIYFKEDGSMKTVYGAKNASQLVSQLGL